MKMAHDVNSLTNYCI